MTERLDTACTTESRALEVAFVSFYDDERFDEYPVRHSLSSLRLAAYVRAQRPQHRVRLFTFPLTARPQEVAAQLGIEKLDLIALPSYSWMLELSLSVAVALTDTSSRPLIVVGGPHATTLDSRPNRPQHIFVAGPGEDTLVWLCDERGRNPSFDGCSLPEFPSLPAYSGSQSKAHLESVLHQLVDRERKLPAIPTGLPLYSPEMNTLMKRRTDETYAWYETARGCIYSCSFCGHNTLPFFACIDEELVAEEFANMQQSGIRAAFICDPILGGVPARGKRILQIARRSAPLVKLKFYMRPEFLDDEYIDELAVSNIDEMYVGLQTFNEKVSRDVRANRLDLIQRYLPQLYEVGLSWRAELIVGLPGDDLAGLTKSIRYVIDELRPTALYCYPLTVIPGTPLEELLDASDEEQLWIRRDPSSHRAVESSSYTQSELEEMKLYAGMVSSLYRLLTRQARAKGAGPPSFTLITGIVQNRLQEDRARAVSAFLAKQESDAGYWSRTLIDCEVALTSVSWP